MQIRIFVKAVVFVAAIAFVPASAAYAHGSGGGMMGGQGPGMMNPDAMGQQGAGPGKESAMPGQGYGYGMGPWMMGPGMMNMMPMMHGMMMGPGMMGQGYGMGPGMMGQGYGMGPGMMGQGYGMGPGMMGYGYGMGPGMMGAAGNREVTEDSVRGFLERQLEMRGLERLKVGGIDQSDERVFKADIVTKEDSLVVRVVVDRRTGFPVAFE